jgi:hypothetical protein
MKLLLAALLTALIVILAPGSAQAVGCGIAQSKADYESPDVQVRVHKMKLLACRRATGKELPIGVRFKDGMGTYEDSYVLEVFGGRWVWVLGVSTAAESGDAYDHTVIDLRTRKSVSVTTQSDYEPAADAVGVPGALVVADAKGVKARFTDGRVETLSTLPGAYDVAAVGNRVYWRTDAGVPYESADDVTHTATLGLPALAAPRTAPRARTIGRCKPRPGAKLLMHDNGVVVTRAGGATWACSGGRTARVDTGTAFKVLYERRVAYSRPGFAGVVNVWTGERQELPAAPGPLAVTDHTLLTSTAAGVFAGTKPLASAPGTELAVHERSHRAYWLDAAGAPQSAPTV